MDGVLLVQSGSHDRMPTFFLFKQVHLSEQPSLMKIFPTLKLPLVNLQSMVDEKVCLGIGAKLVSNWKQNMLYTKR